MSAGSPKKRSTLFHPSRIHALKHHPLVVPVVALLLLFFIALIGWVQIGSTTIGPTDSRVVHVYVDGEGRTLPTRANTVNDLLQRLNIEIFDGDIVEPELNTEIVDDDFTVNIYRARLVTVVDEGSRKTVITAQQSPRAIARDAGIEFHPEDIVEVSAPEDIITEGFLAERVSIMRAKEVRVNLYGEPVTIRTHATTVGELLAERDIEYSEDSVFPEPTALLADTETVFITEVGRQIRVVEEAIAQAEDFVDDPNLEAGETEVREEGRPGKKVVIYDVNEAGEARNALREVVISRPVNRVVARGIRVVITNPTDNVKIGEQIAASRGFTGGEWYCLYQLWQRESGWSSTAGNPVTGAYGIPQSLPGEKMATAGADWRTNPRTQINWGLGYIEGRYGSPCGAWNFFLANNWY